MNPFSLKRTSTAISLTCTNLRGLGLSVKDLADKKINRILNLSAEIHILIDTRCNKDDFCNFLDKSKFKYLLSNYKHVGTYTNSKGVVILYNNKKVKIDDVSIIEDGMLVSFRLNIQNESIRILGCYAPSSGDEPEFFVKCKDILNQSNESHGMIIGDLNTTLDPILDRKNYKTDGHKKSRLVINNWISENEMLDFFRFTNGNEQIWTYKVKEKMIKP